ncbi:MAG TPA: hypothetical protein VFX76_13625 [Roseiflexaceae bacterium]|nr:hypothetical protein [Roseiflexaceae bacterium]
MSDRMTDSTEPLAGPNDEEPNVPRVPKIRRSSDSMRRSDASGYTETSADDMAEYTAEVAAAVADVEAAEVAERTTRRRIGSLQAIMLVLLGISLLIHALTLTQLFRVRNTLRNEIDELAAGIANARNQQIRYDISIDQNIPINLDVPIQRQMTIPIQTEVRIQQQISVPVDTVIAGTINIPIPIDTTVPVSTTVPINFDQSVNISTTVPLKMTVPVQIDLNSSQISGYLDKVYQALIELREEL